MDSEQQLAWYKKAAARGNLEALKVLLARAKNLGDWSFFTLLPPQILKTLTKQEIGEAVQGLQALAQQGIFAACTQLGRMYEQGLGVTQNKVLAAECYNKVAIQGSADFAALCRLAEQGIGEAIRYLRSLAEAGRTDARTQLARMYEQGLGVTQNNVLAAEYYGKLAIQGNFDARIALHRLADQGISRAVAILTDYYGKLAIQGNFDARIALHRLADQGISRVASILIDLLIKQNNFQKALAALRKLAERGNLEAMQCLRELAVPGKGKPYRKKAAIILRKLEQQGKPVAQ